MIMKPCVAVATIALLFCAGHAMAAGTPLQSTVQSPHILPVFVQVDKLGKVVSVTPAQGLAPGLSDLLRHTLAKMITHPAHDAHGKAIATQFIVNLSVQTAPASGGNFTATFTYVSAQPVPAGRWHWVRYGAKMVLARADVPRHDMKRQTTRCTDDIPGSGHDKAYFKNGVYVGREPDAIAGRC